MTRSGPRHVRIFSARIRDVVRRRPSFFDPRDDLSPNRIVRIFVARDEIEKMRRDCEGEFVAGKEDPAALFIAKIDMLFELSQRCDPVLELPFPIIPEFGRYARPIARRMRHELFSIAIPKRVHLSKDEK